MPKKKKESIGKRVGRPLAKAVHFIGWLTGVLVALAVGFSMTKGGALYDSIPYIPTALTAFAGWVVVILTIVGAVLAIVDALS